MSDWKSVATLNSIQFTAPSITLTDGSGSHSGSTARPLFSVGLPGEAATIVNMRNEHDDKTVHTISTKFTATNTEKELPYWTEGSHIFVSNDQLQRHLDPTGEAWSLGRLNRMLKDEKEYMVDDQAGIDQIIQSIRYAGVLIANARKSSEFTYPSAKLSLNFQGLTEKVHDVWGVNTNKSHWLWFIVKPIAVGDEGKAFEFVKNVPPNPQTANLYTTADHRRMEKKYRLDDDFSDGDNSGEEVEEFTGAIHQPKGATYRLVIRPYWTPAEEHPALPIYQSKDGAVTGSCILVGKWYDMMRPRNDEGLSLSKVVCDPAPADHNKNLANSTRRLFISGGAAWSYGL
jgi:hypothetical protein